MVLQRWDPFRDLRRVDGLFARQFRDFRHGSGQAGAWPVPLDITHEDDSVVVEASIPGVKPDEVEVTIEDGRMTIEGKTAVRERREPERVRRPREAHRQVLQGDTLAGDGRRRRGGVAIRKRRPDSHPAEAGLAKGQEDRGQGGVTRSKTGEKPVREQEARRRKAPGLFYCHGLPGYHVTIPRLVLTRRAPPPLGARASRPLRKGESSWVLPLAGIGGMCPQLRVATGWEQRRDERTRSGRPAKEERP